VGLLVLGVSASCDVAHDFVTGPASFTIVLSVQSAAAAPLVYKDDNGEKFLGWGIVFTDAASGSDCFGNHTEVGELDIYTTQPAGDLAHEPMLTPGDIPVTTTPKSSANLTFRDLTGITGTVTITSFADNQIQGTLMVTSVPGFDIHGTFTAPVCGKP
jgi:hypothetical protein